MTSPDEPRPRAVFALEAAVRERDDLRRRLRELYEVWLEYGRQSHTTQCVRHMERDSYMDRDSTCICGLAEAYAKAAKLVGHYADAGENPPEDGQ